MKDHRTNEKAVCPACSTTLDGALNIDGNSAPKPRDLSVCAVCRSLLTFQDDLTLRLLSAEEISALPQKLRRELEWAQWALAATSKSVQPRPAS